MKKYIITAIIGSIIALATYAATLRKVVVFTAPATGNLPQCGALERVVWGWTVGVTNAPVTFRIVDSDGTVILSSNTTVGLILTNLPRVCNATFSVVGAPTGSIWAAYCTVVE